MRDLEAALRAWRRSMIAGGIEARETLDELEMHVRDDIARRTREGASEQEAVAAALARLGSAAALRPEFDQSGSSRDADPRAAALGGIVALGLAVAALTAVLYDGAPQGPWRKAYFAGVIGLLVAIPGALSWISFQVGRWRGATAHAAQRGCILNTILPPVAGAAFATGLIIAFATTNSDWAIAAGVPLALIALMAASMLAGVHRDRRWPWRSLRWGAMSPMAVAGCAAWIWYMFAGPGYYAELNRVKSALAQIPDVEVLEVTWNHDISLENIWASLRITGKGDVHIFNLTPESFERAEHLHLNQIGPYSIRRQGWSYGGVVNREGQRVQTRYAGGGLDFGPNGDFSRRGRFGGRLPFELRNVQDVVARFDEICAVLDELSRQPQPFRFTEPDGSWHEYTFQR